MASFIAPDPVSRIAWRKRLRDWQQQYIQGISLLDTLAGGDFTKATPADQDEILGRPEASTFLSLLFEHTIEGMYSNPEYGGNRGLAGWKDIGFPGDIQPLGYTSAEVERCDGRDRADDASVVADVLKYLESLFSNDDLKMNARFFAGPDPLAFPRTWRPVGAPAVADGSVFVTSGARNPTNTIMAVALRNMRHLAGAGATGGSGAART